MKYSLFFELLQVSVGRCEALSRCPAAAEWAELFQMAKKQALVGVTASAIERLPMEQRPPQDVRMQWVMLTVRIEQQNQWLNAKCAEVTEYLQQEGFDSCILKGQGMALLYPQPLRRQSGDIDVWVRKEGYGTKDYVRFGRQFDPEAEATYHHVHAAMRLKRGEDGRLGMTDGAAAMIDTEIHYRASWMCNPWQNSRLQKLLNAWWLKGGEQLPAEGFHYPDVRFNALYALVHIFRHLFGEGIGLRQLMDYYYVVKKFMKEMPEEREALQKELRQTGLARFAEAVMYVLHVVFGLSEDEMVVKMNKYEGRFLLDEIMLAGNFGQYDPRSTFRVNETKWQRFVRRNRRNFQFWRHYPSETFWSPLWIVAHRCWRYVHGYL